MKRGESSHQHTGRGRETVTATNGPPNSKEIQNSTKSQTLYTRNSTSHIQPIWLLCDTSTHTFRSFKMADFFSSSDQCSQWLEASLTMKSDGSNLSPRLSCSFSRYISGRSSTGHLLQQSMEHKICHFGVCVSENASLVSSLCSCLTW